MRLRLTSLALLLALMSAFTFAPARTTTASTSAASSVLTVPINVVTDTAKFVGTFTLEQFTVVDGQLAAVGTLAGTFTNLLTGATQVVNEQITLLVSASGTCEILHLELGPLDLDLLGLQIHLDKIVLDITAESGPGNLLGNLLCGIAHLLDQGIPVNQLANLLNKLIALLK